MVRLLISDYQGISRLVVALEFLRSDSARTEYVSCLEHFSFEGIARFSIYVVRSHKDKIDIRILRYRIVQYRPIDKWHRKVTSIQNFDFGATRKHYRSMTGSQTIEPMINLIAATVKVCKSVLNHLGGTKANIGSGCGRRCLKILIQVNCVTNRNGFIRQRRKIKKNGVVEGPHNVKSSLTQSLQVDKLAPDEASNQELRIKPKSPGKSCVLNRIDALIFRTAYRIDL